MYIAAYMKYLHVRSKKDQNIKGNHTQKGQKLKHANRGHKNK